MRPLGFARGALIAAAIVLGAGRASANYGYADGLPNGDGLDTTQCLWCHVGGDVGGPRTPFGEAFAPAGNADAVYDKWMTLYGQDSDNDGASNGLELGDPCGDWAPGGTPMLTTISNPGLDSETTTEMMPACSNTGNGDSVGAGPATPPPPFTSGICAVQGPIGGETSGAAWAGMGTAAALALALGLGRGRRGKR